MKEVTPGQPLGAPYVLRGWLRRPEPQFALKGLGFYAAWYLVYDRLVHPAGQVDAWLAEAMAALAARVLRLGGLAVDLDGRVLGLSGQPGVYVDDGCNGLTTIGLFVGFVLAYPGLARRRAWFVPLGCVAIWAANALRIGGLAYLQRAWPEAFDAVHAFGATSFFYLVVFALWVVWVRVGGAAAPEAKAAAPHPSPVAA